MYMSATVLLASVVSLRQGRRSAIPFWNASFGGNRGRPPHALARQTNLARDFFRSVFSDLVSIRFGVSSLNDFWVQLEHQPGPQIEPRSALVEEDEWMGG